MTVSYDPYMQAAIDGCRLYYHDGDNYILTNAPVEIVRMVVDMPHDEDRGSDFYIEEFNKLGYIMKWIDITYDPG